MVVRRIVTPPPLIGQIPADRAKHVAAHDRGTQTILTRSGEMIINTLVAALLTEDPAEGAGC